MKRNILILSALILWMLPAVGQFTRPDYKAIRKAVTNPKSEYYYPKLLERYKNGDSTFTKMEQHYLYYGYTCQNEYNPYDVSDVDMKKYLHSVPSLGDDDCRKLIGMAQEVLEKNPFKVSAFRVIFYCCEQLDSTELANKYAHMQRNFALAIIESGNGKTPATAFYVNEVEHEYFLLSLFDLSPGSQSLESFKGEPFDVLEVDENDYGLKKLYFNISSFNLKF